MSVTSQLKALEAGWKAQAQRAKADGDFKRVPDAQYIGRLSDAEVTDASGSLRVKMVFTILEGEFAGEPLVKSDGLEGEDSLYYTAKTLGRFGYDPEEVTPAQLPRILKELAKAKPVCRLQAKTKNDYQNVYVNAVLDDYQGEEAEEDDDSGAEDDGAVELAEGMRVTFPWKGAEEAGEVVEVVDAETARVKKDSDGKVAKVKIETLSIEETEEAEEEEEAPAEEDEEDGEPVELAIGMRVSFPWKGAEESGEVTEILDEERAKVKKDSDSKIATVKIENLSLEEDGDTDEPEGEEEEEEEEAPAPPPPTGRGRGRKAPAAAPEPEPAKPAATRGRKPAATPPAAPTKPAATRPAVRRGGK